jgi:peptide/nickel transport system permease protein
MLGGVAGYIGGWLEDSIMRLADLTFAFPTIILAMAIAAALGRGLRNAVIAVVIVSWPSYARLVKTMVKTSSIQEYVLTARLFGKTATWTLWREILPNIIGPILVMGTLELGNAVLLLAGLSFLGLGAQPPTPEWGSMVTTGVQYLTSWWLALFPGLAIFSVVLAFNLLGDRIRDQVDPLTRPIGAD